MKSNKEILIPTMEELETMQEIIKEQRNAKIYLYYYLVAKCKEKDTNNSDKALKEIDNEYFDYIKTLDKETNAKKIIDTLVNLKQVINTNPMYRFCYQNNFVLDNIFNGMLLDKINYSVLNSGDDFLCNLFAIEPLYVTKLSNIQCQFLHASRFFRKDEKNILMEEYTAVEDFSKISSLLGPLLFNAIGEYNLRYDCDPKKISMTNQFLLEREDNFFEASNVKKLIKTLDIKPE